MKNILKRFAAPDTGSRNKHFSRAVVRLTIYYALSAFFILSMFSMLIYVLYIRVLPPEYDVEVDNNTSLIYELRTEPLAHEMRENLMHILLLADAILFSISIVLGYVLSRATLAPIERMHIRQRRFVAEAAHELRTPLAVLLAGADHLATRERPVQEYREFVDVVRDESKQLGGLARDLLFLARRDEGVPATQSEVNLSETTKKIASQMRWYIQEKDCTLRTNITPHITLSGSEEQLSRLLQNLLKNATDYNKPKGVITVGLVQKGDVVTLSVTDTGIGIPKDKQESIFERFYTVDASRSRATSGTGLGLAIVQEIVSMHSGTISVTSEPGKGTTFTVTLPTQEKSK